MPLNPGFLVWMKGYTGAPGSGGAGYGSPAPLPPGPTAGQYGPGIASDVQAAQMVGSLSGALSGPSMQLIQLLRNYTQAMASAGPVKSSSYSPALVGTPQGPPPGPESGVYTSGPYNARPLDYIAGGQYNPGMVVLPSQPFGWGRPRGVESVPSPGRTGSQSGAVLFGGQAGGPPPPRISPGGIYLPDVPGPPPEGLQPQQIPNYPQAEPYSIASDFYATRMGRGTFRRQSDANLPPGLSSIPSGFKSYASRFGVPPPRPPPPDFEQYDEPIGPEIAGSSSYSSNYLERIGGRMPQGGFREMLNRINYKQKVNAIKASGGDPEALLPPGYEDITIFGGEGMNPKGTQSVRVPSGAAAEIRATGREGSQGYTTSQSQLNEILGRNKPQQAGALASAGESFLSTILDPKTLGAHIGYIGQAVIVWTAFRTAVEMAKGTMQAFASATVQTNDALARSRIVMSAPGQTSLGGPGNVSNAVFGIANQMANYGVSTEQALKLSPQILAMSGGLGGGNYGDLAASTGYMNAIFGIEPSVVSRSLQRTSTILGRTPTQISNLATAAYRNAGVAPEEFMNSLSAVGAEATLSQSSPEKVGGLIAGLSLMSHTTPEESGNLLFTLQRAISTPQGGGTLARYGINSRNIDQGSGLNTPASILDMLPQFSKQYSQAGEAERLDILSSLGLREKRKDVEVILNHYEELSQLQEKITKDTNAQSDAMREMRFNLGFQAQRAGAQVGTQFTQAVSNATAGPVEAIAGGLSIFNDIYKAVVDVRTSIDKVPVGIVGTIAGLIGLNKGGANNDLWQAVTNAVKGNPLDLMKMGLGQASLGDLSDVGKKILNDPMSFLNNPGAVFSSPSSSGMASAFQEYRAGERSAAGGRETLPAVSYNGFMPFGQYQLMQQYLPMANKMLIDAGIGIRPTSQGIAVLGDPSSKSPISVRVSNIDDQAKSIAMELASRRMTGVINLPNLAEMSVNASIQQKIFSLYGSTSQDLFLNGQNLAAGSSETGSAGNNLATSGNDLASAFDRMKNQLDSLSGAISKLVGSLDAGSHSQDMGVAPEFEQNPGMFGSGVYMDGNLVGKAMAGYGKSSMDAALRSNYAAGTGNSPTLGSPIA